MIERWGAAARKGMNGPRRTPRQFIKANTREMFPDWPNGTGSSLAAARPGLGAYLHDDDDPQLAPMACLPLLHSSMYGFLDPAATCHSRTPFGQQLSYSSALTNRELSQASGPGLSRALGQSIRPQSSTSAPILLQPHNGHDDAQI